MKTLVILCALAVAGPALAKGETVKKPTPVEKPVKEIKPTPKGIVLSEELETI